MRQRDVWLADLNPVVGSEQAGRRPVVIVSGDALNAHMPVVIVVPLTTRLKGYPTSVRLEPTRENGLTKTGEAIAFQIRAIDKDRLRTRLGAVTPRDLKAIIEGVVLALTQ